MEKLSKIISLVLLLSFASCSTIPPTGYQVPVTPIKLSWDSGKKASVVMPWSSYTAQTTQTPQQAAPAQGSTYWNGDGGKGKSITILPPKASGLAEDQAYLPDFVANELVSNFNTFSAMTLFDRVSNRKQYDELLSGIYSDDDAASLDLGHLASTEYMLLGDITKTSTGFALQLTVNKNSDKTTAATYSGTVSIAELDNLLGVRRASMKLLQDMGVQLTAQARAELNKASTSDQLSALTSMAQGIIAQRQGTEVAALTYFIQAAAFDASLTEAVNRTNVLSANISTGNIGANVRNDFAWFEDWKAKLTETETLMSNMLRNTNPQRSVWYSNNVREEESARDYTKKTTELRIDAVLHTHAVFPVSVQKTVQTVYDGLQTTKRAQAWRLDSWPWQGVTNNNPFNKQWGDTIPIAFEVLNEQGKVIGRQTVEMNSRYSFSGTRLEGPGTAFTTVRFTGVKGDDISDRMSIRIATINGQKPDEAGISRIAPISTQQMQASRSFSIYNGVIRPSSNNYNLGAVTIPAELWGERVTGIANGAFENSGITSVTIPNSVTIIGNSAFANNKLTSVTIPEGVTIIGDKAFANNHWTTNEKYTDGSSYTQHHGLARVIIANSVTSIGQEAFAYHWTTYHSSSNGSYTREHYLPDEVTIGTNVKIGNNAIGGGFEAFYTKEGKQAGVYKAVEETTIFSTYSREWKKFGNKEAMEQTVAKMESNEKVGRAVLWGLLIVGGIGSLIWVFSSMYSHQ